jgi:hypothetical protein
LANQENDDAEAVGVRVRHLQSSRLLAAVERLGARPRVTGRRLPSRHPG